MSESMFLRIGLALFVLFAAGSLRPAAAADLDQLKKEVFSNCENAAALVRELTPEEEAEIDSYLGRILAMPSISSGRISAETAAPPPGAPNAPVAPLRDLNLWQLFEPTREAEAKQCALTLLQQRIPRSVEVVPDMLDVALERGVTPEYRDRVLETAWRITVETAKGDYVLSPEKFRRLVDQALTHNNAYAENVLIELRRSSLPFLAAQLKTPDIIKRHRIKEILLAIDSTGALLGPSIIPLIESADDGLRVEVVGLLSNLSAYWEQALPVLLMHLNDPSADVVNSVYAAIEHILDELSELCFYLPDDGQQKLLLQQFERLDNSRRAVLSPVVLQAAKLSGTVAEELKRMAQSPHDELRALVLPMTAELFPQDVSLGQLYKDALYAESIEVRIAAVRALTAHPAQSNDTPGLLIRLLKSVSGEQDVEARQRLILEVARGLFKFPLDSTIERMTPYFLEALGFKNIEEPGKTLAVEQSAAPFLVKLGEGVRPALIKLLRAGAPLVRRRALEVLVQIKPRERKTLRALAELFKDRDPEVRLALYQQLKGLGGEGILVAREALGFSELQARTDAARLLVDFGVREPELVEALIQGLAGLSCKDGIAVVQTIVSLDTTRREVVENRLFECFSTDESARFLVIDSLAEIGPLSESAQRRLSELLDDKTISPDISLRLVGHADKLGLPSEKSMPVLLSLLHGSENTLRTSVIKMIGELGQRAETSVADLKAIAANVHEEPLVRNWAVAALVKIKPGELDYIGFFLDELRSERFQWAQSVLKDLEPGELLPLVRRGLTELPDERKALALRLAGQLGEVGHALLEELLSLANGEDINLRYPASVALLRLNPKRPEVIKAVRRQLAGKYRRRFLVEKLPPDALDTMQQIAQNPDSFVELRAAQELLASNRPDK